VEIPVQDIRLYLPRRVAGDMRNVFIISVIKEIAAIYTVCLLLWSSFLISKSKWKQSSSESF
jgi:hypothetical protein